MTSRYPRQSWLFLPGADRQKLLAALGTETSVAIQDLEDLTPAELKNEGQALVKEVCAAWAANGIEAAVRVRPLEESGMADVEAAVEGGARIVVLAKAETPEQMAELADVLSYLEGKHGRPHGDVQLCPTIESPSALTNLANIAVITRRITAAILASEDMATSLGLTRTKGSVELAYARSRFRFECSAAGILPVDCPFTFDDDDAARRDLQFAADLGYQAKSLVHGAHARLINDALGPQPSELDRAQRIVDAFEAALSGGDAQAVVDDGHILEVPAYTAAVRLLARSRPLPN
jgi:citrate lyase subunit beta/citryl-CoA lyase